MDKPDNQTVFEKTYICSSEICRILEIERSSLTRAVERGLMPKPIVLGTNSPHLWLRDDIQIVLKSWKKVLQTKRGSLCSKV